MPNSSFPRDFGEGSTTNRLDGTSFAYFKTLHLSLHASSQRWLLPKAPMQHAAVTTSACSFCCIAACKRVMATMLLTHPVITHQHSCGWLTHDEDIHLVIYPVSVYLYPNFYAIATICVHSHDLNLLLSFTCAGCNQHPVWVYPPKMVLPHKKVNTHCKSRSDRLRMCPKHMIKKRKDVNKLFLVNVTLTSTNAKNPMSLSTYIYIYSPKFSWVHHGVRIWRCHSCCFSPSFFDLNLPPKTTASTASNNLPASSQRSAPSQALKAALYMMMLDRILRGAKG